MVLTLGEQHNKRAVYALRKKELINTIVKNNPNKNGFVVLFAGFEHDRVKFWQESSFFYYTGITQPGVVWAYDLEKNKSILFVPNYGDKRSQWVHSPVALTNEFAKELGVDAVEVLGAPCNGYQLHPFFDQAKYSAMIERLHNLVSKNELLFTLSPRNEYEYVEQRLVLERLCGFVSGLRESITDISDVVATMRRTKDVHEIDLINKAIALTHLSHEAAARAIEPGATESEVQANLEFMMTGAGARPSFPSIVASGKNATILHYQTNDKELDAKDLVVVDIGAVVDGYCADLTRTYPVSGKFTKRQKELYEIVLATQEHIAHLAKPGFYLNNPEHPEKSLHHCAKKFLEKYKLDQYFVHGIGHFLGLDVHDVGNSREMLKEGDVITIEPGVYIPQEGIGIRIEDNYWIVKNGAVCLSESLPKKASEIEEFMEFVREEEAIDDMDEMNEDIMHDEDDLEDDEMN